MEHLCNEDCGNIKLLFVRRGTGKEDVTFQFKTENVNVNAESYIDFKGTITIRAGEFKAYAKLKIDDNGQCKQPRVLTHTNCWLCVPTVPAAAEPQCARRCVEHGSSPARPHAQVLFAHITCCRVSLCTVPQPS